MLNIPLLDIRPAVAAALHEGRAVVALESTLISHGLPWPINLQTAFEAEGAVREEGAVPATIAVWQGRPTIGLKDEEIATLARGGDVQKASSRDLASMIARGRTASTTVAATMVLAHRAGIHVLATGGIGGAHRDIDAGQTWDISADLWELARTPVAVVCAGAKSIVDLPRTLEILESHGVPVLGYGTTVFPAFYVRNSSESVPVRVDTPQQAAAILTAHWKLSGAGVVLAQPVAASSALDPDALADALRRAETLALAAKVRGPALTPFLLSCLAELTQGKSVQANQSLLIANAQLAARIAVGLSDDGGQWVV